MMRIPFAVLIALAVLLNAIDVPAAESPVEQEWKAFEKSLKSLEKKSQQKEIDQELKLARKSMEQARKAAKIAGPHAAVFHLKTAQGFLRNINIRSLTEAEDVQRSSREALQKINEILQSLHVYRSSIISRNGLQTVLLEFPEGFVQMNWPESAVTGEAVSGTVRLRVRNSESPSILETIQKDYKLEIQGQSTAWSETYALWKLEQAPASVTVRVTDYFGNTLAEETVASSPAAEALKEPGNPEAQPTVATELTQEAQPLEPVPNVQIPHMLFQLSPVAQTGEALQVSGDFDGNISTTLVRLDRRPVFLLAESTRGTILSVPDEISAPAELYIREMDLRTRCRLFPIQVNVSPITGSLEAGQPLPVTIQVNGVSRLRKPVVMRLEGLPADSFTIDGGAIDWSIQKGTSDSLSYSRILMASQPTPFRLEAWIDAQPAAEMCIPPPE